MSHIPNILDIKTDLRRAIMSSFSKGGFEDINTKTFLENAEKNLQIVGVDKSTFSQVSEVLKKAKNPEKPIEERREDLLTASSLVF